MLLTVYAVLTWDTSGPGGWLTPVAGTTGVILLFYGALVLGRRLPGDRERSRDLTRAQLQALIDASPLAITAGDLEGRIILWSDAAERIFGWTAGEVLGRPYPAVPAEMREAWLGMRDRVMSGETITGVETKRTTRAGRIIEVSVSAAPIYDDRGQVAGTVALIEDLSQARDAEREVEALETQLRQAQKLEVVGRLAAGIAHDFNNLLTAIQGNTELILSGGAGGSDIEEDLQQISRSADRAAALTRQLLNFAHQGAVDPRPLDVNRLVKDMESLLERLLGETIELRVELSVDAGTVLTDPNQIEQVVMNLVVNARDALPDGGRISVQTGSSEVDLEEAESLPYEVRPGPYSIISVIDTGVGMAQETVERIFEPFFTTKPVGVGTGLGLSTVYSIVKQARGHIRVDSEPGVGTTFRVYLPRAEGDHPAGRREERAPAVEPGGGSETILVVEDEEAVLSMARRTLERQGYEVLPALSGREGLALALKHPGEIDMLFCDVAMPDLTGREVAERVKDVRPGIHILMTSGYGARRLTEEGILKGVEFLPKPYSPRDLTARVRQMLGAPSDR